MGFRALLSHGVFLKPLSLEQPPQFYTAPMKDYPQVIGGNPQDFANLVCLQAIDLTERKRNCALLR